jgi:hypothetical protein
MTAAGLDLHRLRMALGIDVDSKLHFALFTSLA